MALGINVPVNAPRRQVDLNTIGESESGTPTSERLV